MNLLFQRLVPPEPAKPQYHLRRIRYTRRCVQVYDITHQKVYIVRLTHDNTVSDVYQKIKTLCLKNYPKQTMYKIHMLNRGKVINGNSSAVFSDKFNQKIVHIQVNVQAAPYRPILERVCPTILISAHAQ